MTQVSIRAAGILIQSDHILLESLLESDVWGIPGGGVQAHEMASEACRREYLEELGLDVRCRSLAIFHESLHHQDGRVVREHGFYFRIEPIEGTPAVPFEVESRESQLKFRWFHLTQLDRIEFVPKAVRRVLPHLGSSPIFLSEQTVFRVSSDHWSAQFLAFSPIDETQARQVLSWHYDPPYDVYNADPDRIEEDVRLLLDPENCYQVITDLDGELIAYCCFGPDGQVPGGDYAPDALDIGLGVRPDLTGRGLGRHIVEAVLGSASQSYPAPLYRVTVAAFNKRALRVWENAGFQPVQCFHRTQDAMPFCILARTP